MMGILKYLLSVLVGLFAGVVLVVLALYLWPFDFEKRSERILSAATDAGTTESFILRIHGDNVLGTHGGTFPFKPFPEGIPMLDGGNLAHTFALVTKFRDRVDGEVVAFGTELEIAHADSSFLSGRIMTHTVWSIVVPGRGTVHLYQIENNWRMFKHISLPMMLSGEEFNGEFVGESTGDEEGISDGESVGTLVGALLFFGC